MTTPTHPVPPVQHGRVGLPVEMDERPGGHHDTLVLVGLVAGQVSQQLLRHSQGAAHTHLPHSIQPGGGEIEKGGLSEV